MTHFVAVWWETIRCQATGKDPIFSLTKKFWLVKNDDGQTNGKVMCEYLKGNCSDDRRFTREKFPSI